MAQPTFDDEEEKPLDPAVEKVRRKLVRFVAINLGLLFVALMAVVGAIVYKSRTRRRRASPAATFPRRREWSRPRSRCPPAPGSSRSRCRATAFARRRACRRQPRHLPLRHRRAAHDRPLRHRAAMTRRGEDAAPARRLATVSLLVADYDEAIAWYCDRLGFALAEDVDLGDGKRWVTSGRRGRRAAAAGEAEGERQAARIGNQAGGRVFAVPRDRRFCPRPRSDAGQGRDASARRRATRPMARWRSSPISTAICGT